MKRERPRELIRAEWRRITTSRPIVRRYPKSQVGGQSSRPENLHCPGPTGEAPSVGRSALYYTNLASPLS
jgi:hypothetical protein